MSKRLDEMRARLQSESIIPDEELEAAMAVVEAAERWEETETAIATAIDNYNGDMRTGRQVFAATNECAEAKLVFVAAVRAFRGEETPE